MHIRYRPQNLAEVFGHRRIVDGLKLVLTREEGRPHSFLFSGPTGIGKTTLARILKQELGCSDMDFQEMNMSNTRGIDTIRELNTTSRYAPINGKSRIYLLDEVQKITSDGQQALLKLLEDVPPQVYFILCTTEPEKLLPTIRSRCTTYQLNSLPAPTIVKLLKWICSEEKVDIGDPVLVEIARVSNGLPREAVKILDQIIDLPDDEKAMQAVMDYTVAEAKVIDVCRLLMESPSSDKWKKMSVLIKALDAEPESVRIAIREYFASVLLNKGDGRTSQVLELFLPSVMYSGRGGLVATLYLACKI